jgi:hypothetical protein
VVVDQVADGKDEARRIAATLLLLCRIDFQLIFFGWYPARQPFWKMM